MITQLDRTENDCRNKMDAADAQYKIQQKKNYSNACRILRITLAKSAQGEVFFTYNKHACTANSFKYRN